MLGKKVISALGKKNKAILVWATREVKLKMLNINLAGHNNFILIPGQYFTIQNIK